MGLIDNLRSYLGLVQRSSSALSFQEWVNYFNFNGNTYAYQLNQTLLGDREEITNNFGGLVAGAYKSNGVVFACMVARQLLFSEARFQFRQMRGGRPGDLFGNESLSVLEHPWPGATTGDLLSRAIQDADLAGTAFFTRPRNDRIRRLRPDWVTMILGSPNPDVDLDAYDYEAELLGLLYHPGGRALGRTPEVISRQDVAVFAPIPDPIAAYRGVSWLTPIIREIQGDSAATSHKVRFFENGATVNLVVQTGVSDPEKFKAWIRLFREAHEGEANAYRTLYLSPGADVDALGSNFQQADFKIVQGAGETRIAAASGMHPVIVGLSEGLQGSALNTGNFTAARRLTADKTLRPMWRNFAGSMATIVPPPAGAELWYDDRDIPFLAEDVKDAAEVQQAQAGTVQSLINSGYKPDEVIDAVTSGDLKRLMGAHTGLYSVQLQPPLPDGPAPAPVLPEPANGDGRALLLEMARSVRPDPSHVTFEKDSIHVETPITVEPAQLTIADGAIRSETPVTVEPAQMTIERGAVQVDAPVTVEPAQVTIAEGAVRSETPVTVHTPDVTIAEGAVRVDSPVTVHPTEVTVEPAQVTVEQPSRRTIRKDVEHDAKGRITRVTETEE